MAKSGVTVIIPTFNHAAYIEQTLNSVLAQSLVPEEVIVVDDGSSDNTEERIYPYLSRITFWRQAHLGISATLNRTRRAVRTPYLMYLASDDWLMPTAIEHLRVVLREHGGVGVVHANRIKVDQDAYPLFTPAIPIHGAYSTLPSLISQNTVYSPAIMCRREAILEAGPMPDYPYCQDWWLWISIALCGWHFFGLPEPLGYYRRHPCNTSRVENLRAMQHDEVTMLSDWIDSGCLNAPLIRVAQDAINHRQRVIAWLDTAGGQRSEARTIFAQLARIEPLSLNTMLGLAAATMPTGLYYWLHRARWGAYRDSTQLSHPLALAPRKEVPDGL